MTMRLGETCYKQFPVETLWKTKPKKVFFLSKHRRLTFPSELPREPTFEVLDSSVFCPLEEMKVHTTFSVLFNYLIKIVQSVKF